MSHLSSHLLARIRFALLASLISFTLPALAAPLQLQINGSNTVGAQLAPRLVEGMLRETGASNIQVQLNQQTREHRITAISNEGQAIEVMLHAHGSGTAFSGLMDGTAQVGAASRPIRPAEAVALAKAGDMFSAAAEQVIGLDGLAIIVHPDNPLSVLDLEQVAQVFAGRITDWRELGGPAGPIRLYARDNNSGTWETFRDLVLTPRQLELDRDARRFASTGDLSRSVGNDTQGIGFVGLSGIAPSKAIALTSGDSRPMLPTAELVTTEDYPLSRRLFMYIRPDETNPLAQDLITFTQSWAGQEIVDQVGFVGQNIRTIKLEPQPDMPLAYQQLADEALRLSVNFRTKERSAQLDNKAWQDMDRLEEYLHQHDLTQDKVVLVGFGDPRVMGAEELLARLRSATVRRALAERGITVRDILAIGNELPVATNDDHSGRRKNRRVEMWVYCHGCKGTRPST